MAKTNEPEKISFLDQILKNAENEATPIDFAQLAADGILLKRGAWYEVVDVSKLPEHVRHRVKRMKKATRRTKNGTIHGPLLVQFRKANASLIRLHAKHLTTDQLRAALIGQWQQ